MYANKLKKIIFPCFSGTMKKVLHICVVLFINCFSLCKSDVFEVSASNKHICKQCFEEKLRHGLKNSLVAINDSKQSLTWLEEVIAVELKEFSSYHVSHYFTNISVGTPPQTFVVDIDFWTSQDLSILDSKASLSKVQLGLPPKHVFYSNESSTFKVIPGNFSEGHYTNKGSLGNDVVQLGGLHLTNITFAQIDQIAWRYNEEPIDGILGICPHNSLHNISSFLAQITDQLDQPIVSIFNNGNIYSNGSGQLTLGGEDLDNCQSNWKYVPRKTERLGAHVTTVETFVNGVKLSSSVNGTLSIYPVMFGIQVPKRVFYLFTNASQAVYNKKSKLYEVDCDLSKAGNVTFNIGGTGNITNQFSQQLVLTGSDYIRYKSMLKVCFVSVHGSDWIPPPGQDRLQFGKFFLDRFCVAYNSQTDEIGFANVRAKSNNSNKQTGIKSAGGVFLRRKNNLFVANITLGSPRQNFVAAIDYWSTSDLSVISREANLATVNRNLPTKHTFDSSASKTFHPASCTFTDDYVGKGIIGNDIARLGKLDLRNLTFGVIEKLGAAYKHQPIDAIVGLSPQNSQNNIPNLLQQISVQLIKPVMSLWAYSIRGQYGQGQLTLGAEDETHCLPNWMYVPRYGVGHSVFVSRISTAIQTTTISVAVNTSMTVEPDSWMHSVPMSVLHLFTNASHAVYNSTIDFFVVDCDLRKAEDVIFTLASAENNKQLVLKPEDYISYMPYYKVCFVAVYGYYEKYQPDSIIELGELFLNRRCMAYNIEKKEVGFVDVKNEFKRSLKF